MKKINTKLVAIIMLLAVALFGGINITKAATTLPASVKTDRTANPNLQGGLKEVEYIKNFPVIIKTAENGKYFVYCMNLSATYAADVTFTKTGEVDEGYNYILTHRPNTGDREKDFYIAQMAVWYYEDYLNQNNFNLVSDVKKYIIRHKDDNNDVSKQIYALYDGAKHYKEKKHELSLSKDKITFTKQGDYFVSSEIKVTATNLDSKIKYSLSKAPAGAQVVKSENGVIVRVPVSKISVGKQITLNLHVESSYTKYRGYYYFHSSKYQRLLFQEPIEEVVTLKDEIPMTIQNRAEKYEVNISKTDITGEKEIKGATLVVKNEAGKVIDTWVSNTTSHKMMLAPGKYSLTETIAPEGYRLSTTTVEFMLDTMGGLYVKNEKGSYVSVDRVVMVNELKDVVSFAKKDKKTDEFVSGATLVIKDRNGKVVHTFTSTDKIYSLTLDAGEYTLSELKAPKGYVLSKEVIYFNLNSDGTLKVKNKEGKYVDSAMITFYNSKSTKETVEVPATDKSATLMMIGGLALLIGGIACARKTIKEC